MPLMSPSEILEAAGPLKVRPSDALVAQWVAAMPTTGFGQPAVLAQDGRVIGGLARVLAAQQLGLAQVPVVRIGEPRGPKRNASRARPVGFDPKAGGLGVLGGLVWQPTYLEPCMAGKGRRALDCSVAMLPRQAVACDSLR